MSDQKIVPSAPWRDLVLPLVAGLALTGALLFIVVQERASVRAAQHADLDVTAEQAAARLAVWLEHRLASIEQFASQLSTPGARERFAIDAQALFDRSPGIRAVNLVDRDGVIRVVVPPDANELALGRDLTQHPTATVRAAVRTALEEQRPARSRYIDFFQGGSGFAVYWPVLAVDGTTAAVVNAVIDFDEMLASAVPGERLQALYSVSLLEGTAASLRAAADRDARATVPERAPEPVQEPVQDQDTPGAAFGAAEPPLRLVLPVPFVDRPLRVVIEPREADAIVAFGIAWWLLVAGSIVLGAILSVLLWTALHRRRTMERQDAQIRLLTDVLHEVPDGVMLSDASGAIEYLNPAGQALLGLDADALGEYRAQDLVSADQVEWLATTVTRQVEEEGVWQGTLEARALDGTLIPARVVMMRHEDRRGAVHFSTLVHDLRAEQQAEVERRALEVQFHQAQRLESLGVLAGGIAHDFNNLLVSILGNASLALEQLPPDSPARVLIERLERGSERAAELTGQLLAYSGRGRFEPQATDVCQLVGEMVDLLRGSLERRVQLELVAAPPCIVTADPTQIRQLAMNLITNAADATEQGGRVQIRVTLQRCDVTTLDGHLFGTAPEHCSGERDWVQLEVIDAGSGMSDAVIAQIFDPFFSTKEHGKGLGLAAVLGIVRGHGACMVLESTPGVGTRFRVLLPPAEQGVAAPAAPAARHGGTLSGTALLVDDETSVREYLKSALESLGLDVIDVGDGHAGLEAFAEHHERLVLVVIDQSMPGLSGTAAWEQMHALDPAVPGILVSGYDEVRIDRSVEDLGLAGFLQKPFRFAALRSTVQRALGVEADS